MKPLAIPLSQQAGKWLVIRRRPESSELETPHSGQNRGYVPLRGHYSIIWIPACAGMTWFIANEQLG